MIKILHSTVIHKFYERNSGFFLFIFFMMFGVVESTQIVNYHLSLIYGMISSPIFLAIVCLLWSLYMIKCVAFFCQVLSLPENSFLRSLNILRPAKQFKFVLYSITLIYIPVIIYTLLIIVISFRAEENAVALLITGFHGLLIFAGIRIILSRLNSTRPSRLVPPEIRWPWPKPFEFFYLSLLTSKLKTVLFITKIFSFSAIILFMRIPLDHYEYRTAAMGLLFGLAAHTVIIFEFRKLEDHSFLFARSLPLSMLRRWTYLIIIYALLLLPESVLLIVNHIHLIDAILILIGGTSFVLFSHCSLYGKELNMDRHLQMILWLFLIGFGLTLFKLAFAASLLILLLSWIRYRKQYYLHEASANIPGSN